VLFTGTCFSFAFYVHYERPWTDVLIGSLGFGAVLTSGAVAYKARFFDQGDIRSATWHVTLFWSMLLAWLSGMVIGAAIYFGGMQTYYSITSLNHYAEISPDKYHGHQLLDAGIIHFADSAILDRQHSAFYKRGTTYCVAPIAMAPSREGNGTVPAPRLASYDFWAVGTNCCGEPPNDDFECGDYSNPWARAGLRVLSGDAENALYMSAVKQAEMTYGIKATSPLFFYWMQDPPAEVNALQDTGFQRFMLATFVFSGLQLFMVVLRLASLLKSVV